MTPPRRLAGLSVLGLSLGWAMVRPSPARAEALVGVDLRIAYGLAAGGGAGRGAVRATPLLITATAALALSDAPRTYGYGGLTVETLDRTGVGGEGGLAMAMGPRTRVRAGARVIAKPYTLYGATVGATWCWPMGAARPCLDLAGDVYIAGTDLPRGNAVAQVALGLGVAIDAP